MIRYTKSLLWCFLALAVHLPAFAGDHRNLQSTLKDSSQLIAVTTADWNAVDGRLQLYQRKFPGDGWKPVGAPISIVVGKGGMAWGLGLATMETVRSSSDSSKREGDHKSPAGIFRLGTAFGYAANEPVGWRLRYVPVTSSTDCVDDPQSHFYNHILDRTTVSPDWKSAEHMRDTGEAYRWGLVIQHNAPPAEPGAGSCVFMHIGDGPGHGTEGCTAMAEPQIVSILGWLRPSAHPLLVQMPISQYRRLAKQIHLPERPDGP